MGIQIEARVGRNTVEWMIVSAERRVWRVEGGVGLREKHELAVDWSA